MSIKKKKKVFILSDGRIYFEPIIPFHSVSPTFLNLNDSFKSSNWIYRSDLVKKKFIKK